MSQDNIRQMKQGMFYQAMEGQEDENTISPDQFTQHIRNLNRKL